ncbi:hypothetical protein FHS10_005652 [Mucilaginibacter dorajii]|jgi:hypothetical protein|nr:hypothetical protein [Mucilaginibacter dorajii]
MSDTGTASFINDAENKCCILRKFAEKEPGGVRNTNYALTT